MAEISSTTNSANHGPVLHLNPHLVIDETCLQQLWIGKAGAKKRTTPQHEALI